MLASQKQCVQINQIKKQLRINSIQLEDPDLHQEVERHQRVNKIIELIYINCYVPWNKTMLHDFILAFPINLYMLLLLVSFWN